ncbi:DNA-binding transcriptional regulator, LysR family [Variovorax sp. HW608]|uniref:LysR family transcriptional regulator n=1 Tax=Variovorax sp. HW608 TaxID=1034889 RepID=UPI00081FFA44|nr:LysR family transcriptional regulator [Variovorax sp. HW608]SCK08557.1 DNA-binding transcriptional regulator, LysR family [Variovorax sp. HW608]
MNFPNEKSRPDWDLLSSWVVVIEAGSVSEAAHVLHISQAAVSQRLKQLETVFATPLLDRSTRPAQPTAAGQRLYEHAKDLLTRADQMTESVRNVSRAKRLVVRFGCVDSFAATVGPLLIKALSGTSHQIRMWSGITPALEAQIERRQLDLAVTTGVSPIPGISRTPLFSENFYVVLPATFEVNRLGSMLELNRHLPFIRYSSRSLIGQQIDEYLMSNGDGLERTCEFDTTDPLLSLVASGMGFALSTPICIWQSRQFASGIRILPLSQFSRQGRPYPNMSRTFYLAYRQGELGRLPNEIRDVVRIAVRKEISVEIATSLNLEQNALLLPPSDA